MARLSISLLVLVLLASQSFTSDAGHHRNYRSLTDLDVNNLQALDRLVRQDLVFSILQKINETARQQNSEVRLCNVKINESLASCQRCMTTHLCSGVNVNLVYEGLLPILYRPILTLGHFIETIKGSLGNLAALLGNLAGGFLQSLGFVAKDLGGSLMSTAGNILSGAGLGLLNVANGLGTAASGILQGAGSILHGIGEGTGNLLGGVGQGTGQIISQLGHGATEGLSELGQGLANVGGGLIHGAGSLLGGAVDALTSIFGRREVLDQLQKRTTCDGQCDVCDVFDNKEYSKQDVISHVCGSEILVSQTSALGEINSLRQLYNATVMSQVLGRVQFDPSSVSTANGVSFTSVYITSDGNVFRSTAPLYLSDLKTSAKAIANELLQQRLSKSTLSVVVG